MRFVDLFCGSGGLSLGMIQAGHIQAGAFDFWDPALACYNANMRVHSGQPDVADAIKVDLSDATATAAALEGAGPVDLIIGGPPCQEFSTANDKRVESVKADLTVSYARAVAGATPRMFVMENVQGVLRSQAYRAARAIYQDAGYKVTVALLNSAECSMAQLRKRCLLIGVRDHDTQDGFLEPHLAMRKTSPMTVRSYFEASGTPIDIEHYYLHPLHYGRKAIFSIDAPSPTMRGINRGMPKDYQERVDRMVAEGLVGTPSNACRAYQGLRNFTTRERGMLQGFPGGWDWAAGGRKSAQEQLVGNAVPVGMARLVGQAIAGWAAGEKAPAGMPSAGVRQHEMEV
jgi:DNA (cytosine-5)-methyltransferase 1